MNKYIKTDIEQGISFLKVAINNALFDLEEGNEKEIHFGFPIPLQLIIQCAEERGWVEDMNDWDWTNGWQVDYWYKMKDSNEDTHLNISGSLLCGNTVISIENDN